MGYSDDDKFHPIVKPIMKKVRTNGKEKVVRLPWVQQSMTVSPDSKIRIMVNRDIYEQQDGVLPLAERDYCAHDGLRKGGRSS